jgi:hypothetical protein
MTTTAAIEMELPGAWRLVKESGWMPLGANGRMIDTDGWVVCQPHVLAYGHASDRIQRAETVGKTRRAAVAAFLARYPGDTAPVAR